MDFDHLTELKNQIDAYRPLPPEVMSSIDQKFKIEWTYHSNAIEGNTMTLQETAFFLQEGLTSKGKTLKEYLEAQNHAQAIDILKDFVKSNRPITESFIKEIHALLLKGIDFIWVGPKDRRLQKRIHPGRYKTEPNHVINMEGHIHHYSDPLQVPGEIEQLITFIEEGQDEYHPVELATRAHYRFVAIHPFDDGNGRVGRMLMNLIAMRAGYPPIVIQNEMREDYDHALMDADKGDFSTLLSLCGQQMENSLNMMLTVIQDICDRGSK